MTKRDNANLYCTVPVSIASAALGGEIEVPTIDGGRSRVKIPEGSQSGRQMRLRAKGMPALRGNGTGDMFIELAVETPVNLTARQKELLQEFDDIQRYISRHSVSMNKPFTYLSEHEIEILSNELIHRYHDTYIDDAICFSNDFDEMLIKLDK